MAIGPVDSPRLKKVLVIEDDETYRNIYKRWLGEAGFTVVTVESLLSAEKALQREFFHVAVVDLSLIGEDNRDGLEILRLIKTMREGTEPILITAFGGVEEGANAKTEGAFAVFEKSNLRLNINALPEKAQQAYEQAAAVLTTYDRGLNFLARPGDPQATTVLATNFLSALPAGDFNEVDSLVRRLLVYSVPLLRLQAKPQAELEKDTSTVKGQYWSKLLGKPVLVKIGPAKVLKEETRKFQESPDLFSEEGYRSIVTYWLKENIGGVVFAQNKPNFDVFLDHLDPADYGRH